MHLLIRITSKLLFGLGILSITACDEDPPKPVTEINQLTLEVTHNVGAQQLALNSGQYVNANQEPYTVQVLQYYLSNVKLANAGTSVYSEPYSYHLVNEMVPASKKIQITNLTPGTYNELEFSIGVDAARNQAGNTEGDLSPNKGMFWSWEEEYKFLVISGTSDASNSASKSYQFHVADDATYRTLKITLPTPLVITSSSKQIIKISADLNQLFASPQGNISFAAVNDAMGANPSTLKMADSYSRVFTVTQVLNQ